MASQSRIPANHTEKAHEAAAQWIKAAPSHHGLIPHSERTTTPTQQGRKGERLMTEIGTINKTKIKRNRNLTIAQQEQPEETEHKAEKDKTPPEQEEAKWELHKFRTKKDASQHST